MLRAALLALFLLPISGGSSVSQENPDPANYYIDASGAGSFWALRINDVTIWRHFEAEDTNFSLPVNVFLQEGRNEIDVTFVTIAGSPIKYNAASPNFHYLAELDRIELSSRDSARITLLNLALDQAENQVYAPEQTFFGLPVKTRDTPPMRVGRDRADQAELADGWGEQWTGRRVAASFDIPDPLPDPPWASAPVIEDSPQTRAALLDAYRRLHAVLQSGDRRQVLAAYDTAWRHVAQSMHYASLEEYLEKVRPLEDLAPRDGEGTALQPVDLVMGPQDFQIERMAGGRLIRIIPDPIIWSNESDPDFVFSSNVAFFMDPQGDLVIGAVLY